MENFVNSELALKKTSGLVRMTEACYGFIDLVRKER